MNYQACYDRLMERARGRVLEGYCERHHVVPRCIRPNRDTVNLTPEEHYVAHQLLVKIHPGNKSLIWAAINMTGNTRRMRRSNKIYGWLRRRLATMVSEGFKGREFSDEHRAKLVAAKLGKPAVRGLHTEETRKRIGLAMKGRQFSPEHRAKLAAAKLGNRNRLGGYNGSV